jgi:ubiquinone/menaquinone biosynthesis C-methylase UbiE
MVCHGGFALDEAIRRSWYTPETILQDLLAGMTFIDIGCGEGFFSILAAKKVGKKGKVFAVDSDNSAIEKLNRRATTEALENIIAEVGNAEETVFCSKCADFVFFSMVLHDFNDPTKVLQNAYLMTKSTGRLVNLDWKKQDMPFGPPVKIRFSEEYASSLIKNAGFRIEGVKDAGSYHYVVNAKPLP